VKRAIDRHDRHIRLPRICSKRGIDGGIKKAFAKAFSKATEVTVIITVLTMISTATLSASADFRIGAGSALGNPHSGHVAAGIS